MVKGYQEFIHYCIRTDMMGPMQESNTCTQVQKHNETISNWIYMSVLILEIMLSYKYTVFREIYYHILKAVLSI